MIRSLLRTCKRYLWNALLQAKIPFDVSRRLMSYYCLLLERKTTLRTWTLKIFSSTEYVSPSLLLSKCAFVRSEDVIKIQNHLLLLKLFVSRFWSLFTNPFLRKKMAGCTLIYCRRHCAASLFPRKLRLRSAPDNSSPFQVWSPIQFFFSLLFIKNRRLCIFQ